MPCDLVPPEHRAICHILESPMLGVRRSQYVKADGFDWMGLLAAAPTLSSGGQLLIRLAHDLWTASGDVGLCEVIRSLDSLTFDRVLEALRMCRSAYPAPRSQWLLDAA